MNTQDADAMLQNIFSACDMAPNTIPIDKLMLRRKLSMAPYNTCLTIIAIQLFVLLLLPFALFFM